MWVQNQDISVRIFEFGSRVMAVGFSEKLGGLPVDFMCLSSACPTYHLVKVSIRIKKTDDTADYRAMIDRFYHNIPR